jgi:antitoxin MazE
MAVWIGHVEIERRERVRAMDVWEEGGRIVVEKPGPMPYDIDALVAGITDENRHEPITMGEPVGREAW